MAETVIALAETALEGNLGVLLDDHDYVSIHTIECAEDQHLNLSASELIAITKWVLEQRPHLRSQL